MKILRSCFCALLSIGIITYVLPVEAQVNNICPIGTPGTTIFYGNGVSVTGGDEVYQEASNSLRTLQDALESAVIGTSIESESRYYCIAWNPSGGLLLDLFQSVEQLILDDWLQFWRYLGNLDLAPDSFRSLAVKIAAGVDSLSFVHDPDLQTQVAMYRAQVAAGRKIVVVSHSQGNFYTNKANNILYNGLDGQPPLRTKSFGVVAVAEPADNVAGKDLPYTTLLTDSVILAVIASAAQAGFPLPLLPNTLDFCIGLCHYFDDPYLKPGTNSRTKILNDVIDVIAHLISPNTPPPATAFHEDFEGTVPIVMDSSTCHQDPQQYGYMRFASIFNGIAVSPIHSLTLPISNATGGFCFGGFLDHLDTITAYVRISGETTNSWLVLVSQGAAAPARGCMVIFNAGSVNAHTADYQYVQQIGTYNTDTFYKIFFVVDLNNQSCRIAWADGPLSVPIASDTQGAFDHWSQLFMLNSGAGATMYIDDIVRGHMASE